MTETEIETSVSPAESRFEFPLWYSIMVCLGSAAVGGYFGAIYQFAGILLGALGGIVVAVFWLKRVSKFRTQSVVAAIFGGIGWGIVAGLMDTVWLHTTGLIVMHDEVFSSGSHNYLGIVFAIAIVCALVAGAVYGLLCMIILEVYRYCKHKTQADG